MHYEFTSRVRYSEIAPDGAMIADSAGEGSDPGSEPRGREVLK